MSRQTRGIGLVLGSAASNQTGAALGAMAFPTLTPVGVVAVRQIVTAVALMATIRPRVRGLTRRQWLPIIGLAVVFGVMNLGLYSAVDRIGLGLAVTLEFLGPLTIAVCGARGTVSVGCALTAALGVVTLTRPGPTTDYVGIGFALIAALSWACYILLNRSVGRLVPGVQGSALAGLVAAGVWMPIAIGWLLTHRPTVTALVLAALCGVLSSIVPYVTDLTALRWIPAHLFGTLTSINPVWAALIGVIVLGQGLEVFEWIGIGLIVVSNASALVAHRGADAGDDHQDDRRQPQGTGRLAEQHPAGDGGDDRLETEQHSEHVPRQTA
ncbi:EamA family transporter [Gordonia polyisoprenivorans]